MVGLSWILRFGDNDFFWKFGVVFIHLLCLLDDLCAAFLILVWFLCDFHDFLSIFIQVRWLRVCLFRFSRFGNPIGAFFMISVRSWCNCPGAGLWILFNFLAFDAINVQLSRLLNIVYASSVIAGSDSREFQYACLSNFLCFLYHLRFASLKFNGPSHASEKQLKTHRFLYVFLALCMIL